MYSDSEQEHPTYDLIKDVKIGKDLVKDETNQLKTLLLTIVTLLVANMCMYLNVLVFSIAYVFSLWEPVVGLL